MQTHSVSSPERLLRNPKRGRIAGLCSGLSERIGVDVFWIRLAVVLSVFVSFSTTFWVYLILWLVIPARTETPMPDVAFRLWWQLRKIDRLLARAHRKLAPELADEMQGAFDLVKLLAPHFDDIRLMTGRGESIRVVALQRFPTLLRQFMLLPRRSARQFSVLSDAPPESLEARLMRELNLIEQELRSALDQTLDWVARPNVESGAAHDPEVERWRRQLASFRDRLAGRVSAGTLELVQEMEEQLAFLLSHPGEKAGFDLEWLEVRKIAHEYLPDALDQYLRLPPDRAREQILASGKTAEQALYVQLELLSERLQAQTRVVFEEEARGLMVHGRFLHEKFGELREDVRLNDVGANRR